MRFFRKTKQNRVALELDSPKTVTATRALYQGTRELPRIQMKFELNHGVQHPDSAELVDEITIEMDIYQATAFMDQMHSSLKAAMPSQPGPARNYPFGG